MKQSGHNPNSQQQTQNQKNEMSDDPGDGARKAFKPGPVGSTPVEKAPENDSQNQSTIEAFGEAGAGVAAKE
ncbi:hypothetical protein [uncultured Sphingomonas sp.]|uniref:hypothetical protein n=1 Tax=uncultured Sphingomonas sp. TaxID=158754 RepID=UPI0025DF144E|nr:hypothetical protein [uncultured Sphingomonas sp.]